MIKRHNYIYDEGLDDESLISRREEAEWKVPSRLNFVILWWKSRSCISSRCRGTRKRERIKGYKEMFTDCEEKTVRLRDWLDAKPIRGTAERWFLMETRHSTTKLTQNEMSRSNAKMSAKQRFYRKQKPVFCRVFWGVPPPPHWTTSLSRKE